MFYKLIPTLTAVFNVYFLKVSVTKLLVVVD